MDEWICPDCGGPTVARKDSRGLGLPKLCSKCLSSRQKVWTSNWRSANPAKIKEYSRKAHGKRRGYEAKDYPSEQLCDICGQDEKIEGRQLSLDHNHTTGQLRGWLCHACNLAIGLLNEDVTLLANAAAYLETWEDRGLDF